MASISTRIFNYIPNNYLLLQGEEWVRPLPQLSSWNRLRLGLLCSARGVLAGGNIADAGLFFGLTSGRWNTNSAYQADNAISACLGGSAALGSIRSWTYAANSSNPYYASTNTSTFYRRYNNPITGQVVNTTNFTVSPWIPLSGIGIRKRRVAMVLDISRNPTSGVYTFNFYYPSDQTTDWRMDQLLEATDSNGLPVLNAVTWTNPSAQTMSISEETGAFDTVSVYWQNITYGLEVYGICASMLTDSSPVVQTTYPFTGGAYDVLTTNGSLGGTPITGTGAIVSGAASGKGWGGPYVILGTTAPQPQHGLAGSNVGIEETFDTYANGTFATGIFNGGTNWGGPWVVSGTYPNPLALTGVGTLYGSTLGADETFDTYANGTFTSSGSFNAGTNWAGPWVVGGTYSNTIPLIGGTGTLYGSLIGSSDTFETYSAGSVSVLNAGSNWPRPFNAVYYAGTTYSNPAGPALFMGGTSSGFPWDNFESYSVGSISLLTGGTGWGSYGTVYNF